MIANRSIPQCTVIPVLTYPDIGAAIDWLCGAFGFTLRLQIGDHRAQLNAGDGAIILAEPHAGRSPGAQSVLVRVEDVDSHCERARSQGARVVSPPTDYPYGERQYKAEDLAGHQWSFSQSIADVDPETWGGTAGKL